MLRASLLALSCALVGCSQPTPPPAMAPPAPTPPIKPSAFRIPADSEIPQDQVGVSVRRGRALLAHTGDSLPGFVGSSLRCTSCHLNDGTTPNASPWIGVYSRFPQYRARNAKVNLIEDRINDCFMRSLNGKALPLGSRDIGDIIAYLAFLSRGVAPPGEVPGQGFKKMEPLKPDTGAGRLGFVAQCARCHGANGAGLVNPSPHGTPAFYPPLWGPRSFNIGAGMARLRTAASFLRYNMPFDQPGTLTDQQAFDIAAFVLSHPRSDFAPKARDWPKGDPPPDVAYPTKAARSPSSK